LGTSDDSWTRSCPMASAKAPLGRCTRCCLPRSSTPFEKTCSRGTSRGWWRSGCRTPSRSSRGDIDEAKQFLKAVRAERLYALWAVAIGMGLRRGEALALWWKDIDFEKRTLRVVQSVRRVNGKLRFAEPKTYGSRRNIPLPDVCAE